MRVVEGSEILTTSGWKEVSTISGDTVVLITGSGDISFKSVRNKLIGETFTNELFSKRLSMVVPVGSKTLTKKRDTEEVSYQSVNSKIHWKWDVLRGSEVKSESRYDASVVIACALQADGSYNTTSMASSKYRHKPYWEIQFSRERKIERFQEALDKLDVKYSRYAPCKRGKTRFYIPEHIENYFVGDAKEKNFDLDKILSEGKEKDFLEEIKHWDGSIREDGWTYCSTNFHNIGVVQALAHITGQSANFGVQQDTRPIFKSVPKPNYRLNISDKSKVFGHQCRKFREGTSRLAYELNTVSGVFIRQGGYVFIVKE